MSFKRAVSVLGVLLALGTAASVYADDQIALDPPEKTAQGKFDVSGNWSALKRGWNLLDLQVVGESGAVTGAQVTIDYVMVEMPMTNPARPVVEKGNGVYEKQILASMSGHWKFDIEIKKGDVSDHLTRVVDLR